MDCPRCGAPNLEGSAHCSSCGSALGSTVPPDVPGQPPEAPAAPTAPPPITLPGESGEQASVADGPYPPEAVPPAAPPAVPPAAPGPAVPPGDLPYGQQEQAPGGAPYGQPGQAPGGAYSPPGYQAPGGPYGQTGQQPGPGRYAVGPTAETPYGAGAAYGPNATYGQPPPGQVPYGGSQPPYGSPFGGQQYGQPSYPGPRPSVPNYLVWSILTTLFCCLPAGVVSIVYAAQVNGKLDEGDYATARKYSGNARTWAMVSAGLGVLAAIIYVIFILFLGVFSSTTTY